jgi:hypothetical protein
VRRFVFILLMLMLPWQAIASTIGALAHESEAANVIVHIGDHELGVTHHHHDDGSISYDDTDASQQHLSNYAGTNGAALLTSLSFGLALPVASIAPPEFSPPFLSGPFLEGLRRPPRALG